MSTKITIKKINLLAIKLVLKGLNSRVKKRNKLRNHKLHMRNTNVIDSAKTIKTQLNSHKIKLQMLSLPFITHHNNSKNLLSLGLFLGNINNSSRSRFRFRFRLRLGLNLISFDLKNRCFGFRGFGNG